MEECHALNLLRLMEKDLQVKKEETTIIPQNTTLRNGIKLPVVRMVELLQKLDKLPILGLFKLLMFPSHDTGVVVLVVGRGVVVVVVVVLVVGNGVVVDIENLAV